MLLILEMLPRPTDHSKYISLPARPGIKFSKHLGTQQQMRLKIVKNQDFTVSELENLGIV